MFNIFQRKVTSISVYKVAERTGISLTELTKILGWSDDASIINEGYLTSKELKFLAKLYVNSVKHLQKRTYAKKDKMAPAKLAGIRGFLASFVSFDFLLGYGFDDEYDSLTSALDEDRIESYFYNIIFGNSLSNEDSRKNFSLRLKHDAIVHRNLSKNIFRFVFRSRQFYVYPDEEEGSFNSNYWSYPLAT